MIYDTIYAHQDKYDDIVLGIKSTALKFGDSTKSWLTVFASTMSSSLLVTGKKMFPFNYFEMLNYNIAIKNSKHIKVV